MNARVFSAVGGALLMWALAVAWWLQSERSAAVAVGALAVGALGTAMAIVGSTGPEPTRLRLLLAAVVGAVLAAALAFFVNR